MLPQPKYVCGSSVKVHIFRGHTQNLIINIEKMTSFPRNNDQKWLILMLSNIATFRKISKKKSKYEYFVARVKDVVYHCRFFCTHVFAWFLCWAILYVKSALKNTQAKPCSSILRMGPKQKSYQKQRQAKMNNLMKQDTALTYAVHKFLLKKKLVSKFQVQ